MVELLNDDAQTVLDGDISDTDGTLDIVIVAGSPTNADCPFRIWIGDEACLVTSISGNTYYIIRGIENSVAAAHTDGTGIFYPLSSGVAVQLAVDIARLFGGAGGSGITQLTGDVTAGPGSGSQAATIANDAVTYAKIQNVGANEFLGRAANSSGDVSGIALSASQLAGRGSSGNLAPITLGSGLSMSGTTLSGSGGSISSYPGAYVPGNEGTQLHSAIMALSPLGYWKCDESSGNFVDSSGSGFDLTVSASIVRNYSRLIPTVAASLAGATGTANQTATRSGTLGLSTPVTGDFTFNWVMGFNRRTATDAIYMAIMANGETEATNYQFSVGLLSGQIWYLHEHSTGINDSVPFKVAADNLPTVCMLSVVRVASTKTVYLYVNGKLADTRTYANDPTGGSSANFYLAGDVNDHGGSVTFGYAAVWASALSASDLLSMSQAAGF